MTVTGNRQTFLTTHFARAADDIRATFTTILAAFKTQETFNCT